MRAVVIACEIVRDELEKASELTGLRYDTIWMDSALHMFPEKMHVKLQETLDGLGSYDYVLLAMGYCGNAVSELCAGDFTMVLPRADDCTALMCGGVERRKELTHGRNCIYITRGWLHGAAGIPKEYEHILEKHDRETADMVLEMMYEHYEALAIIDTGAYEVEGISSEVRELAALLHKDTCTIEGTVRIYCDLLAGSWPTTDFIVVSPHSRIASCDLKC